MSNLHNRAALVSRFIIDWLSASK